MKVRVLVSLGVLMAIALLTPSVNAQDNVGDLCATSGNLTKNCRFDQGFRAMPGVGSVAREFGGYTIAGRPDFNGISCDSPEPPCQRIWSDGELWEAGIYQQVAITPNQGYRARIGWFTPMCDTPGNVGRIGIDPTGGTDPNSANVVWNDWIRLNKSNSYGVHQVKTLARNATITVFISAKFQAQCSRGNAIWIDAVILVPDGSVAPAPPTPVPPTDRLRPAPTNTRIPPTRTPTLAAATATPLPTATATATATASVTATATPTETETALPTVTVTRRPTSTATSSAQSLIASPDIVGMDVIGVGLLGASGCSLMLAVGLGGFAYWYWRRR